MSRCSLRHSVELMTKELGVISKTEGETVVIVIDQLAGGTAEDYAEHICDVVDELAMVYSNSHQLDYQVPCPCKYDFHV